MRLWPQPWLRCLPPQELRCASPVVADATHSVVVAVSDDGFGFSPQQQVLYTFGNPETEPQLRSVEPGLSPLVRSRRGKGRPPCWRTPPHWPPGIV
jgi:hypothetical protein